MAKSSKNKKPLINRLGYGAFALYAAVMLFTVAGVYGFNVTNLLMKLNATAHAREELRNGRMVIATPDRLQCRSYRFDNQTVAVGTETTADCDLDRPNIAPSAADSFGAVRNGFNNR